MSKLSVQSSPSLHWRHMYFSIELFPIPAGAWTVITVGSLGPTIGICQEFSNRSWIEMFLVSSLALEKYCSILALSSMSSLAAFFPLLVETTSFWCKLLVLLFRRLWPFFGLLLGLCHSENSAANCSRI